MYACHGCGIVFTQPDRFYAVSKLLSVCDVWCRICGSNAYLVISRPTAAEVVGECQGCGVLYVPRLWLRGLPGRIVRPPQRSPPPAEPPPT